MTTATTATSMYILEAILTIQESIVNSIDTVKFGGYESEVFLLLS